MQFNDIGKKPPTFIDASIVANEILTSGYEFDFGEMYYNKFRYATALETTRKDTSIVYSKLRVLVAAILCSVAQILI